MLSEAFVCCECLMRHLYHPRYVFPAHQIPGSILSVHSVYLNTRTSHHKKFTGGELSTTMFRRLLQCDVAQLSPYNSYSWMRWSMPMHNDTDSERIKAQSVAVAQRANLCCCFDGSTPYCGTVDEFAGRCLPVPARASSEKSYH